MRSCSEGEGLVDGEEGIVGGAELCAVGAEYLDGLVVLLVKADSGAEAGVGILDLKQDGFARGDCDAALAVVVEGDLTVCLVEIDGGHDVREDVGLGVLVGVPDVDEDLDLVLAHEEHADAGTSAKGAAAVVFEPVVFKEIPVGVALVAPPENESAEVDRGGLVLEVKGGGVGGAGFDDSLAVEGVVGQLENVAAVVLDYFRDAETRHRGEGRRVDFADFVAVVAVLEVDQGAVELVGESGNSLGFFDLGGLCLDELVLVCGGEFLVVLLDVFLRGEGSEPGNRIVAADNVNGGAAEGAPVTGGSGEQLVKLQNGHVPVKVLLELDVSPPAVLGDGAAAGRHCVKVVGRSDALAKADPVLERHDGVFLGGEGLREVENDVIVARLRDDVEPGLIGAEVLVCAGALGEAEGVLQVDYKRVNIFADDRRGLGRVGGLRSFGGLGSFVHGPGGPGSALGRAGLDARIRLVGGGGIFSRACAGCDAKSDNRDDNQRKDSFIHLFVCLLYRIID